MTRQQKEKLIRDEWVKCGVVARWMRMSPPVESAEIAAFDAGWRAANLMGLCGTPQAERGNS